MAPAATKQRKKRRPRSPDAQKTGPKPLFGERMTGAQRQRRRMEKLGAELAESLARTQAAREDMDRLAAASQQALETLAGTAAEGKAKAATDGLADLVDVFDAQVRAAQDAGNLATQAWAAARRFEAALETALHLRGKVSRATPVKEAPAKEEAEATIP